MSEVNEKGSQLSGDTTSTDSGENALEDNCFESITDTGNSKIQVEFAIILKALDEAKDEAQKNRDGWQRANATVDRLKSEIRRLEAKAASVETNSEFASFQKVDSLLPLIDDLDRAIMTAPKEIINSEWLKGITLIRNNSAKALLDKVQVDKVMLSREDLDMMFANSRDVDENLRNNFKVAMDKMLQENKQFVENMTTAEFGFTTIDPTGEAFDPRFHQAVGIDGSDEFESGYVTLTVQKGYRVGNYVLRPALVRVAQ